MTLRKLNKMKIDIMALTRRSVRRRPYRRYRNRAGRRNTVNRNNRLPRALVSYRRNNVHSFKRSVLKATNISTNTTSGALLVAYNFQLADLPNSAEFTALYDQYKITGIKLDFIWRSTNISQVETQNTQQQGAPYMYYVIDQDDNTAGTVNELREYSKAKRFIFDTGRRTCSVYFKPCVLSEMYLTALTTGYSPGWNRWIDCAAPTMPYYGFKAAVQQPLNGITGVASYFDVECTYYFMMRDPR